MEHATPAAPAKHFHIFDTGALCTLEQLIADNPDESADLHAWARNAQPGDMWDEGAGVQCIAPSAKSIQSDFYGNGDSLPRAHPDVSIDLGVKVQALCAALDTARKALAKAAAMQVVQPALEEIKRNAAWAMNETAPAAVFPEGGAL